MEIMFTVISRNGGSNPPLSAKQKSSSNTMGSFTLLILFDAVYPVDYEKEKGRINEASKEKWDAYFKEHPDSFLEEDFLMMDRLARGKITAEEYNSWAKHYYK